MRVQVNIADDMVEKIDSYASKFGCSRSSLCSVLIGQGIMSYEKQNEIWEAVGESMKKEMTSGKEV